MSNQTNCNINNLKFTDNLFLNIQSYIKNNLDQFTPNDLTYSTKFSKFGNFLRLELILKSNQNSSTNLTNVPNTIVFFGIISKQFDSINSRPKLIYTCSSRQLGNARINLIQSSINPNLIINLNVFTSYGNSYSLTSLLTSLSTKSSTNLSTNSVNSTVSSTIQTGCYKYNYGNGLIYISGQKNVGGVFQCVQGCNTLVIKPGDTYLSNKCIDNYGFKCDSRPDSSCTNCQCSQANGSPYNVECSKSLFNSCPFISIDEVNTYFTLDSII